MGAKWLRYSLLALSLFVSPLFAADLQPLTIRDFSPGLYTTKDSADIPDGASQDCENVDVWKGTIETRRGSVLQNSTSTLGGFTDLPIRFEHEYIDSSANIWMLAVSSNTLFGSKDAGVSWTLLTSTHGITSNSAFSAVNSFGNCYLTDGTTDVIKFNGTNVDFETSAPRGLLTAFYAERLWFANVVGERSVLRGSGYGDPKDWVNDGYDSADTIITTDEDSFTQNIRENDGYSVTALTNYGPGLVIFKEYSMDMLITASDGITFILNPISNTVGTTHQKSIQVVDNMLIFLSPKGYYAYDYNSNKLIPIDKDIEPTVKTIKQLDASSRSKTYTSQSDFSGGSTNWTSTSLSGGDIVLSTWTDVDTSSTDFVAGTLVNMTTTTTNGSLFMVISDTEPTNNSFEDSLTTLTGWTLVDGSTSSTLAYEGSVSIYKGQTSAYSVTPSSISLLDVAGSTIATNSYTLTFSKSYLDWAWTQRTISLSSYKGQVMRLHGYFNMGGTSYLNFYSDYFLCSGTDMTFYTYDKDDELTPPPYRRKLYIDYFQNGVSTNTPNTFLSQTFDTVLSTPSWIATTPSIFPNGHSISFQTQSSSDGLTWDSLVDWSTGSAPVSNYKRYIRYKITISTASAGTSVPYVNDVPLSARSSTGSWVSDSFSLGAINSWGLFTPVETLNDGIITYSLYTDTDTVKTLSDGLPIAHLFVSSQTLTANTIPTIPTDSYGFLASTFTITSSTQDPKISSLDQAWYEGGANFPVASLEYEGDYLSSVAISSTTGNDKILVYDRNGRWTPYSGLNAYCMTKYRQKPYIGSYQKGNIFRIQADDVTNDSGTAISSYWTSKDFDFGYPVTNKTLQRYYITARQDSNSDAKFEYGVNRGSLTPSTLDLDVYSGFYRKSITPTSLTYSKGIQHRFKFSNDDLDDIFSIHSITIKQRLETDP